MRNQRHTQNFRPRPDRLVAQNIAELREKRARLRSEIIQLMELGAAVVERSRVVGKDRDGNDVLKTWTQPRGLTADERARVSACQQEVKDIDATLRLFEP